MSGFPQKVTKHDKTRHRTNMGSRLNRETRVRITREFKVTVINMVRGLEDKADSMQGQVDNANREMETQGKYQKEMPEIKKRIEIKYTFIRSFLDFTQPRKESLSLVMRQGKHSKRKCKNTTKRWLNRTEQ